LWVWTRGCRQCAAGCADAAANQGPCRRSASTARQSTDCRSSAGTDYAAANCSLAGTIGVSTRRQTKGHTGHRQKCAHSFPPLGSKKSDGSAEASDSWRCCRNWVDHDHRCSTRGLRHDGIHSAPPVGAVSRGRGHVRCSTSGLRRDLARSHDSRRDYSGNAERAPQDCCRCRHGLYSKARQAERQTRGWRPPSWWVAWLPLSIATSRSKRVAWLRVRLGPITSGQTSPPEQYYRFIGWLTAWFAAGASSATLLGDRSRPIWGLLKARQLGVLGTSIAESFVNAPGGGPSSTSSLMASAHPTGSSCDVSTSRS
jgi:hypothetical protein